MSSIHYTKCPACSSLEIKNIFSVKDFTVSGELFPVAECNNCKVRFTQGIPGSASIAQYYQSEDYISHTNTSKGFINRLYQLVRKRTIRNKRKLIEKVTGMQKGVLLDVGSGTGSFVSKMKQAGWQVTGLEPDEAARKVAKNLYGIELENTDKLFQLPIENFDVITLWHVLEHVHDLTAYIQQLRSLLKSNGKLIIAVPNYTSKDAAIYKEYWAAYDVPRHLYHFSPYSMEVLMKKNGLTIKQYKPMWYDSFYISSLSSKYKNGKIKFLSAFWNGFTSNLETIADVKKCSSVIYIIGK